MKDKFDYELNYWLKRKAIEGKLKNNHYEYFYTTHFGLTKEFYRSKVVLDIGCGPRGSLEWADIAEHRIGLDPLSNDYLRLGAVTHSMEYVAAQSENIPFADNFFDAVFSFNSLDHVNDLHKTISEIIRVVQPGGTFLLLTDVNHRPTHCEPLCFSFDVVNKFTKAMHLIKCSHYEKKAGGMYESILESIMYDHTNSALRYGILSAMFVKNYRYGL